MKKIEKNSFAIEKTYFFFTILFGQSFGFAVQR
jgi:hypothetical protein